MRIDNLNVTESDDYFPRKTVQQYMNLKKY